jgi:hypothetical protein
MYKPKLIISNIIETNEHKKDKYYLYFTYYIPKHLSVIDTLYIINIT